MTSARENLAKRLEGTGDLPGSAVDFIEADICPRSNGIFVHRRDHEPEIGLQSRRLADRLARQRTTDSRIRPTPLGRRQVLRRPRGSSTGSPSFGTLPGASRSFRDPVGFPSAVLPEEL